LEGPQTFAIVKQMYVMKYRQKQFLSILKCLLVLKLPAAPLCADSHSAQQRSTELRGMRLLLQFKVNLSKV
jgi:hypothetical protein